MPDSKSASPPPDDEVPRHDPEEFDDAESVELGDFAPVEEGASALSFSGSSSPRNGGSSSGVRSWEELVKESASDSGIIPAGISPAAHDDEIDPASDQDLLKEVLADEPPPSDLILKDPSHAHTALPVDGDSKVRAFELPPELAGSRPGDSSILTMPPPDPGQSGMGSDIFGSSSRVDLLRTGGPASGGSAEALSGPQSAVPGAGDSQTFLTETPGPGAEASAVDLGGQEHVDLPFRADSGVKVAGPPSHGPRSGGYGPDSGTVDLLGPGDEELGFSDSMTSPGEVKPPKRLPPVVIRKGSPSAWLGGGAAGLVLGILIFGGLWYAGVVPNQKPQPAAQPVVQTAAAPASDNGDWPARVQAAEKARDDEAKKAADAAAEAQKVRDDLAKAVNRIQETERAGADAAKQVRERADPLARQIQQAEAARNELKATLDKATADKSTADSKLRDADTTLTALRNQLGKAEADARAAAEKSDEAEAARKQVAAFAAEVAKRLQAGANASNADLLARLDRALTRPAAGPTTSPPATNPTTPAAPAVQTVQTPEQARQAVWSGMTAYRSGNYYAAEQDLNRVAASSQATAIDYYYLGLAQARSGHEAEADKSLRRGWELEKISRPPPSEVDAAFERLGRGDRELINRYRRP
jgi:hypothetical protein